MSSLDTMKMLISLARVDGRVADRERNYLLNIGRANGFYPDEINPLIESNHALVLPNDLTDDQKFEYVFTLVELMKIDERMYKEEMMFCSQIAGTLGYDQEVMYDLLLHIKAGAMSPEEKNSLKELTRKHLLPKK
jgi:hypothetical protein